MNSINPYQSPLHDSPPARQGPPQVRTKSLWAGPLLSIGVLSFLISLPVGAMNVSPERRWMAVTLMMAFVGLGVLCSGISFHMYRNARRAQKWRSAAIREEAQRQLAKQSRGSASGDR